MRRALLAFVLFSFSLAAQTTQGIRIEPNTPTAGAPVRIMLTENLCRDDGDFTVTRNGSLITISYVAGDGGCVLIPYSTSTFDIGPLPVGNYEVRVVASDRPADPPAYTHAFAVVQPSVPTLDEAALLALFAILAVLALRRV
jgi:hypothetical protein